MPTSEYRLAPTHVLEVKKEKGNQLIPWRTKKPSFPKDIHLKMVDITASHRNTPSQVWKENTCRNLSLPTLQPRTTHMILVGRQDVPVHQWNHNSSKAQMLKTWPSLKPFTSRKKSDAPRFKFRYLRCPTEQRWELRRVAKRDVRRLYKGSHRSYLGGIYLS